MATSSLTDVIIVDSEELQKAFDELDQMDFSDRDQVDALAQLEAGRKLL